MSSGSPFTQTTLYVPPSTNPQVDVNQVVANVSGLGTSQAVAFVAGPSGIVAGEVVAVPFQVAVPPPLMYIAVSNSTDYVRIAAPDNLQLTPQTYAAVAPFFNGLKFQPSAGGQYIFYFYTAAVKAANAPLFTVQSVLENTIGQFINIGSISYVAESYGAVLPVRPVVSQTIALNTVSAVPNTLNVDFTDYPITAGLNILAVFKVMLNCSGVENYGRNYLSTTGSAQRSVQLVAGQDFSITWNSTVSGKFNGRYSITISESGTLSLPATCVAFGLPNMYAQLLTNMPQYSDISTRPGDDEFDHAQMSSIVQDLRMVKDMLMHPDAVKSHDNIANITSVLPMIKKNAMDIATLKESIESLRASNHMAHNTILARLRELRVQGDSREGNIDASN